MLFFGSLGVSFCTDAFKEGCGARNAFKQFEIDFKAKLYLFLGLFRGVFLHHCFRSCGAQFHLSQKVKQTNEV